ncbi:Uncharacterized protein APZ42_011870 [Daphnia magna]|uniref:Uncharacterized protein n=1 Tax=Daphnia magna TaxID=35525 RepID=A0A0P6GD13_9CRUS|nr:Uncharacterized protein APZ42_011870 [Daphnia magna]
MEIHLIYKLSFPCCITFYVNIVFKLVSHLHPYIPVQQGRSSPHHQEHVYQKQKLLIGSITDLAYCVIFELAFKMPFRKLLLEASEGYYMFSIQYIQLVIKLIK